MLAALLVGGISLNSVNAQDGKDQSAKKQENQSFTLQKIGEEAVKALNSIPPEIMPGDVQDVVFYGDHRPVKIRFHLQVGDEAFLPRWEKFITDFYGDLDADGNGELTLEEAKPAMGADSTARVTGAYMTTNSNSPRLPASAKKQLEAAPMSLEDFVAAMRGSFVPLIVGTNPADGSQGNKQMIKALDTNDDQILDAEELSAARKSLLTLDVNDDEIVGSNELAGASTPGLITFGGPAPQFDGSTPQRLATVSSPQSASLIAKTLVEFYDTGEEKDGRLSAEEMQLGENFASHDKDGDGALDLTELAAYVEADQPDIEVAAKLGAQAPQGEFRFASPADDDDDDADDKNESEDKVEAKQDDDNSDSTKPRNVQRVNLKDLPKDVQDAINEAREKAKKEGKPFELPEVAKKALEKARMQQDGQGDDKSKDDDSKDDDAKDKDDEEDEPQANVNVTVDPSRMGQPGPRVWHLVKSTTHDPTLNAQVEETSNGLVIDLGRFRLEFAGESSSGANFSIARMEEQEFQNLDTDKNKYLDETEAGNYRASFSLMDTNDDNMVFLEEFKTFLAKRKAAAESQLIAKVEDHGYQIFKLLDTNSDDRLSLREIYYAGQRLLEADTNGDGKVALTEIPHNYELKLSRGSASVGGLFAVAFTSMSGQTKPKASVGPAWFGRMDKNGDGDISRREFLGSAEDFQRLDADGDELIDPKEAETAAADN